MPSLLRPSASRCHSEVLRCWHCHSLLFLRQRGQLPPLPAQGHREPGCVGWLQSLATSLGMAELTYPVRHTPANGQGMFSQVVVQENGSVFRA